jgi:hypothetical protein
MRRTAERLPAAAFPVPAGLHTEELCRISYKRPVQGCPTYLEYLKEGDEVPTQLCPIHQGTLKQQAQRAIQSVFSAIGRGIKGIFSH